LNNENIYRDWISGLIELYGSELGEITYTFMTDVDLLKYNVQYLNHDTYTDIISFDYTVGKVISGDILISLDRVKENSLKYSIEFHVELLRVMSHGVLHYLGYKDKSAKDIETMRTQENIAIKLFSEFHVEQ
jgi:rRNA maturation RNase YbeY